MSRRDRIRPSVQYANGFSGSTSTARPLELLDDAGFRALNVETVEKNLLEGGLLVVAVLLLMLGNLRGGLIVAAAIPLSMLFAFNTMLRFGIAGSLMSLGAIDFGLVVDSSVIMVENAARRMILMRNGRHGLRSTLYIRSGCAGTALTILTCCPCWSLAVGSVVFREKLLFGVSSAAALRRAMR